MNNSPLKIIPSLEELLERARNRGFLTTEEIIELIPEPEQNIALIDELYEKLSAAGIAVVDPDSPIDTLTVRSIEDDYERFTALYKARKNYLMSIAVRILQDQYLAEDVAQETLLKAWIYRRLDNSQRVVKWLSTIAKNKSIDIIRSRNYQNIPLKHVRYNYNIENTIIDRIAIGYALAILPSFQRQIIELVYYGGLPVVDVAAHLDEPQNTVSSRKRLALSKLRKTIGEDI